MWLMHPGEKYRQTIKWFEINYFFFKCQPTQKLNSFVACFRWVVKTDQKMVHQNLQMACALLLRVLYAFANVCGHQQKSHSNIMKSKQAQSHLSIASSEMNLVMMAIRMQCAAVMFVCQRKRARGWILSRTGVEQLASSYDDMQTRSIAIITRSARNSPVATPAKKHKSVALLCVEYV